MEFGRGDRVVFAGDSVTDCGRRWEQAPLGDGYVNLLHSLITASHPALGLTWFNAGVSGDTTRDLDRRWEADVIAQKPDWLSVLIGINDVWRGFQGLPDEAVPLDEYGQRLRTLLRRAADATGCSLIVAGPYLIEPDRLDPHRLASERYAATVETVAKELGASFVDTQAAFDRVLAVSPPQVWSDDRIHPTSAGHAVIARAFLRAIGTAV